MGFQSNPESGVELKCLARENTEKVWRAGQEPTHRCSFKMIANPRDSSHNSRADTKCQTETRKKINHASLKTTADIEPGKG